MNYLSGTPTSSHIFYPQKFSPHSNRQSVHFGQSVPSSAERNRPYSHIINSDQNYLTITEEKIKLLLAENDRLLQLLSDKESELISYKSLEQKVQILLNENRDLNKLPENLINENKKLKDLLTLKESENKITEEKYNSFIKLYDQLESRVQSLASEFESTTNSFNESQIQINQLLQENSNLKQQLLLGQENEEKIFKMKNEFERILLENDKLNAILLEYNKFRSEDQQKIVK
jgi:hypothetical protein